MYFIIIKDMLIIVQLIKKTKLVMESKKFGTQVGF